MTMGLNLPHNYASRRMYELLCLRSFEGDKLVSIANKEEIIDSNYTQMTINEALLEIVPTYIYYAKVGFMYHVNHIALDATQLRRMSMKSTQTYHFDRYNVCRLYNCLCQNI